MVMDQIGAVGITWRDGGAKTLSRYGVPREQRPQVLRELSARAGLQEVLLLSTCNRTSVFFVGTPSQPLHTFRPRIHAVLTGEPERRELAEKTFRAWGGEGAIEHLLMVCTGLDSARIGETDIVGQVRDALEESRRAQVSGPVLELIVGEALKVAARIHRKTGVAEGRLSLAELAMQQARQRLSTTSGRVALVGVSPMTERCARSFAKEGIPLLLVNRTAEKARELAKEVAAPVQSLAEFCRAPEAVEVVILATGAADKVLDRAALERLAARSTSGQPPLLIDLAIPADVDPEDARAAGLPLVEMDEILELAQSNRDRRLVEVAEARVLVDEALLKVRRRLTERSLAPMLAAVQRRFRRTALDSMERLFRKELVGLDAGQQVAIEQWCVTLARRFAHLPSEGLKGVAMATGMEGVEAFFERADDLLVQEMEQARRQSALPMPSPEMEV